MIYIKRSVDFEKNVTWVANSLDQDKRRNVMLYAGNDVNGAILAAVKAGMPQLEAIQQANEEIARCKNVIDDIAK
jgi:hypothetical protein